MAVDEDDPLLRSEVRVRVVIGDVNDQSPHFDFPPDDNRTFPVPSAVPRGFPIVTVDARDDDTGENSRVSFDVVCVGCEHERGPLFKINRFLNTFSAQLARVA